MRLRKAQSINEYSICLAVIIFAVIAMQTYTRRGLQGRYFDLVERTTAQASPASNQYEPYYRDEDYTLKHERNIEVRIGQFGKQRTDIDSLKGLKDESIRNGTSTQRINCYDD